MTSLVPVLAGRRSMDIKSRLLLLTVLMMLSTITSNGIRQAAAPVSRRWVGGRGMGSVRDGGRRLPVTQRRRQGRYYYDVDDTRPGPGVEQTADGDRDDEIVPLLMPGVYMQQEDEYLCNSWQVPRGVRYITGFRAVTSTSSVHHILLYGCRKPARFRVWRQCYSPCQAGADNSVLYAWAHSAPGLQLPDDVGFQLGGRQSNINYLVLQIHYKQTDDTPDYSGLELTITSLRPQFVAGVFVMAVNSLTIPPRSPKVHGDVVCHADDSAEIHPFGFRVHTHDLGRVVSGYVISNTTSSSSPSWQLLGKANPQWPQAFYPVQNNVTIRQGDNLAARCTYDSSSRSTNTNIGSTQRDEMCNFYVMFYMPTSSQTGVSTSSRSRGGHGGGDAVGNLQFSCTTSDEDPQRVTSLLRGMPTDSDVLPDRYPSTPTSQRHNVERPVEYEYSNEPVMGDDDVLVAPSGVDVDELVQQRSRNRHPELLDPPQTDDVTADHVTSQRVAVPWSTGRWRRLFARRQSKRHRGGFERVNTKDVTLRDELEQLNRSDDDSDDEDDVYIAGHQKA